MEPIVAIVGFLGAGKTTLLGELVERFVAQGWHPHVVLNDYASADLDARRIADGTPLGTVTALTGSCICCDGIDQLRDSVNAAPPRARGVTLIEANGTTDAPRLMEFLGVGLEERFLPPVQLTVVDAKNWQRRGFHDALEAEQVRFCSLAVLTHLDGVSSDRAARVDAEVRGLNPSAEVVTRAELDALLVAGLEPVGNGLVENAPGGNAVAESAPASSDHAGTHWSSCSIDLPALPDLACVERVCEAIPPAILRVKGCTVIGSGEGYTYFERCPDGEIYVRPYAGAPVTGPKLLSVGPGSAPSLLRAAVAHGLGSTAGRIGKNPGVPHRSDVATAPDLDASDDGG